MSLQPFHFDQLDIKLSLDNLLLNVLYVKFGHFHQAMHAHSHSFGTYELHYVPSGYGKLIADGQHFEITPGTLFMTGPNVVHEQIPDPNNPMAEYCIFFEVLPGDSIGEPSKKRMVREPLLQQLLTSTPFWIGHDCIHLLNMFEVLADQLTKKPIGWYHMVTNILEMIIISTIQQYSSHMMSVEPIPVKTLDDHRLVIIENSFLFHYSSITLERLADLLKLSVRQTQRAVHKQYGKSFHEVKLQARMEAASRLLATTDMSIGDIAINVGFSTIEQFSHAFKKYYHVTASQHRKLMKM